MHISSSRPIVTTLLLLLLASAGVVYWVSQGREHAFPEAPTSQLACLSYTPRQRSGEVADIRAEIERDLQQLSARTRCVRTYSVTKGLDYVPEVAQRLGMRVLLGIWIGTDAASNELEIQRVTELAGSYRDIIDGIVVGNEVLLRREQSPEVLFGLLQRVRVATRLPVTYADVWEFWLRNPQLTDASDFITIHILPYWEDQPVGIDQAMDHLQTIFGKVERAFPGKRVYVGETGWPSAGRQRERALPSVLNQARFTREFVVLAGQRQLPYNFIEAYDQPWKKRMEGTVGGYWGLHDAQGHEKFPLTGPVVADPNWWRGIVVAAGLALLLLGVSRVALRQSSAQQIHSALAGVALGCLGVMQWDYLWQANRDAIEWLVMSSWALMVDVLFVLLLLDVQHRYARLRGILLLVLLGSLTYINLGLVFDARYRDFPSVFVVLTVALLLMKGFAPTNLARRSDGLLMAVWLVLSSLVIVVLEGISNASSLRWCLLSGLVGMRLLFEHRRLIVSARQLQRA